MAKMFRVNCKNHSISIKDVVWSGVHSHYELFLQTRGWWKIYKISYKETLITFEVAMQITLSLTVSIFEFQREFKASSISFQVVTS